MSSEPIKYPDDPCGSAEGDSGAVEGPGICAPGSGNLPVADQFGMPPAAVQGQAAVDRARRELHVVGQRGYRVWLVWRVRERGGVYRELKRIELMPVKVDGISEVDWVGDSSGFRHDGGIRLTEVSLAQVSEHDLMGRLNRTDPEDGVEFFYEVCRYSRCPDDAPVPQRYTVAGLPEYDVQNYQWVVVLTDQHNSKAADGSTPLGPRPPKRKSSLRM